MDGYRDQTSIDKKKMLLIPLITLLLCSVALVGAAYAYTQSVLTIDNNPIQTDYVIIDYTDNTGAIINVPVTVDKDGIIIYTEIYKDGDDADTTFRAYTDSSQTFTMSFYATVESDLVNKFTLSATCNVADVDILKDLVTVDAITDITNVTQGTATKITATFHVKNVTDIGTITGIDPVTDKASLLDAIAEIESKVVSFTVTATPEEAAP